MHFSPFRAALIMIVLCLGLFGLSGRVAYLQSYGREQTIRIADRQQHRTELLTSRRGSIFDSTGMLLAGTVQTRALFVDPKFMADYFNEEGRKPSDLPLAIKTIAQLVDRDPTELDQLLQDKSESRFVRVADHLDDKLVAAINKLKFPFLGTFAINERTYPMGSIAAHILGGVGKEGDGLEGLEMKYERLLAGKNGYKRILKDSQSRPIAVAADDYLPPQHGQHLVLTIDANIQLIAEQELAKCCKEFNALRGEVIVMDPRTGDVLALGNFPTFNPQNIGDAPPEVRRNNALVSPYEPGSTIKPFLVGPAFAQHITEPGEVFPTGASRITSYGRKITDVHGYGQLAVWDILVKSSNIGMTLIAERMGNTVLYNALKSFQFGRQTGIELPGEDPGMVNPLKKWSHFSTDSVAQGYELMVTPMQLARGMCAYANGGRLVTPRIVKGVLEADGSVVPSKAKNTVTLVPQAIDPINAAEIRRILCDVPVRGTATKARSKTWNIFGKTGTAHVSTNGTYNTDNYTSSFVGGAPYENPELVIAMIIHNPDKSIAHFGGAVSAPAASRVLERSLSYLQIPESPNLPPPPPAIADVLFNYSAKLYTDRNAVAKE